MERANQSHVAASGGGCVCDTGPAGSPAIPLKIVRPTARLTLVEATTKKATFLREVIRELQLLDVDVENLRIEELEARTQLKGTVQLATARALRMNSALFGAVRSLLEPGGRLHLYATRSPDISSSSGFAVEAVHKLATGLETRLVVLKLLEHSVAASPMVLEAPLQEGSASHVSRGTSPLRINGRPPSRRKKR
jgi:16S rRNA G527 N7-methylase RsmG